MKKLKIITRILHTKFLKEDPHGSMHMPIYENVAFEFKDALDFELAFLGKKPAHIYSRISNPTVEHLEERLRTITAAPCVIALSSGMAAISNLIMTIASSGDNIITSKHIFGNTYSLFEKTLKDWGLQTRYVDLTKPEQLKALIDSRTKAIFFETITNPQLEVADAKELSAIARKHNLLLVADSTLTPPYIFDAGEYGIDVEVLSTTKYISGGATSVGGLIIDHGTYDWNKNNKLMSDAKKYGPFTLLNRLRSEVFRNMGACMSAHTAYLQNLGLETLPLRVDVSCANTMSIARFLEKSKKVLSVNYPGLESSPHYEVSKRQFRDKPGGLLTFDLESKSQCYAFMNNLKLIKIATNLNDNRTLILHPGSTIFCEYGDELKQEMGISDKMLRLAVGIEDADDLIADIQEALEII